VENQRTALEEADLRKWAIFIDPISNDSLVSVGAAKSLSVFV